MTDFIRYAIVKLPHKTSAGMSRQKVRKELKMSVYVKHIIKLTKNQEKKYYREKIYKINGQTWSERQLIKEPKQYWNARVVNQGRITDVTLRNFKPKPQIKKLNKTEYVILKTGEVGEFVKKERLSEDQIMRNRRSLQVIFRELRQTINYNFNSDMDNQLAVTLTYRENMQDYQRLYSDFKKFMMRLKHNYSDHKLEYICIVEPQNRGAWHCHLLLKSTNNDSLYIAHEDMERIWGHGATRTERLKDIDQYGAYFVAYLSNAAVDDIDINNMGVEADDIEEKNGKKYIKGRRLRWYPDYMQIWRHSRGIKQPTSEDIDVSGENGADESKLKKHGEKTYEKEHTIPTKDNRDLKIITQQYKKTEVPPPPEVEDAPEAESGEGEPQKKNQHYEKNYEPKMNEEAKKNIKEPEKNLKSKKKE